MKPAAPYYELLGALRPLVSPLLITDTCFSTLLVDLNVFDVLCLKQTLSKVAGYGIVVFSALLKLPLFFNIYKSRSTVGLSETSVYLESSMYVTMLVYHTFIQSPVSVYGELYLLLIQSVIVILLIWVYNSRSVAFCLLLSVGFVSFVMAIAQLPEPYWPLLIVYSSTCAGASRIPQIYENFKNGHTGVLSIISRSLQALGGLVRLLTILQDVDDSFAAVGALLPLFLNVVILLQIIVYRGETKEYLAKEKSE